MAAKTLPHTDTINAYDARNHSARRAPADRLSRSRGAEPDSRRYPGGAGSGTALSATHAEEWQTVVGAHEQLRTARLGDGRGGLSLSADPSGNRQAVAGDSAGAPDGVARARRQRARAGMLPHQSL